ncbi:MAG: GFA family protein [Paracoccaceae bacterium]
MTDQPILEGGCLCGALRYRIHGAPRVVSNCHCGMCRRVSGAPFVTWATVRRNTVELTGTPSWLRSSDSGARGFCPGCGGHVVARSDHYERYFDIPAGTLDDPAAAPPERHVFANYKLGWLRLGDDLPAHGEDARSPLLAPGWAR